MPVVLALVVLGAGAAIGTVSSAPLLVVRNPSPSMPTGWYLRVPLEPAVGRIVVIDEVHTPDSSRFWVEASYAKRRSAQQAPEMLDKETVRRYLMDQGFSGHGPVPHVPLDRLVALAETYLSVAEVLTGVPLQVDAKDYEFPLQKFLS